MYNLTPQHPFKHCTEASKCPVKHGNFEKRGFQQNIDVRLTFGFEHKIVGFKRQRLIDLYQPNCFNHT